MKVLFTIVLGIIFSAFGVFAYAEDFAKNGDVTPSADTDPVQLQEDIIKIVIGVKTCQLRTYADNNELIEIYPAGTATKKKSRGLPYGKEGESFKIIFNPSYRPTKNTRDEYFKKHKKPMKEHFPPGPKNPLGLVKLFVKGLGDDSLGIHNTDNESSVGKRVSHGCVRLKLKDEKEIIANILLQNGFTKKSIEEIFAKAMSNRHKTLPPIFLKVRPKVVYEED